MESEWNYESIIQFTSVDQLFLKLNNSKNNRVKCTNEFLWKQMCLRDARESDKYKLKEYKDMGEWRWEQRGPSQLKHCQSKSDVCKHD